MVIMLYKRQKLYKEIILCYVHNTVSRCNNPVAPTRDRFFFVSNSRGIRTRVEMEKILFQLLVYEGETGSNVKNQNFLINYN